MKNQFRRFNWIALALGLFGGLAGAPPAQAAIYSTLGPGGTFDTNDFIGINAGAYADNFTSPVTADVGSVSLALGRSLFDDSTLTVAIHSNTSSGPGEILGIFTSEGIPVSPGPGIVTFFSSTGIKLDAETEYWLSINAADSPSVVDWYINNQGIENVTASREGGIWTVNGPGAALAFAVNPIPEPGSPALGALGLAIVCLWRIRKRLFQSCLHSMAGGMTSGVDTPGSFSGRPPGWK
jgi:hypothetical protein